MPITEVTKDPVALTLTIVADFPVPAQRLWDAYADPRQIERFWGPPTWPATFLRHDMCPAGRSEYLMTGPEGETSRGYWEFLAVDPITSFEVRDGFCHPDGRANDDLPTMRAVFEFSPTEQGSRLRTTTYFNSPEELASLLEMGMEEGTRQAMGQMDAVLADLAAFAENLPAAAQILNDKQVRISRVIRGNAADVWRAYHDPQLMKRWLLGPDGWTMPVCEVAVQVGDAYRYEWAETASGMSFGFTGTLLESLPEHRAVTTEQMIGMPGEPSINELTLTPVAGGTLLTLVITYPSAEVRDQVLATGMTAGMETSYARLEEVLAAG